MELIPTYKIVEFIPVEKNALVPKDKNVKCVPINENVENDPTDKIQNLFQHTAFWNFFPLDKIMKFAPTKN